MIVLVMLLWSEREYAGGAAEGCRSVPLDFRRRLVRLLGSVCGLWGTRNTFRIVFHVKSSCSPWVWSSVRSIRWL